MSEIRVEYNPSPETLDRLGVRGWSIWTKEVSNFPWAYDSEETCYLLEGEVIVTPVHIAAGDLVTFPAGMTCAWEILKTVRKHYIFA